ncbi:FAD-binding domain-containing protein [Wenyingzhuangia sp. chi5]|uniref:FAD-binding domain-containing protein n=1 Tax=Wenyingzhuangia gilva TaxID=3057677 RepID=A0ABT8VQE6_9FLAO|nr:FAD-binding domain-containing protein [Wenyingzhuangia sp. chi5]MDO3694182.1 FAD-binding domain-containing protein [Wenyingzhuangia sp. chi5]
MKPMLEQEFHQFPTQFDEIINRVTAIDPVAYGKSRNYIDGAVSYLSPYISRGVISTHYVFKEVLKRGHKPWTVQKFIQELAWRDYWQQVWIHKKKQINSDLKNEQVNVSNKQIPKAIVNAKTGILAIDKAIENFYETGYIHNHVRMYLASIACNIGQSYWKVPAQWMYYHLLDADWASNALSWQWVVGANSNKKYYTNQENINKYCHTYQENTFLDVPYNAFPLLEIPKILAEVDELKLKTSLPLKQSIVINNGLPFLMYNFYNLDPLWKNDIEANRILLLEPSHFEAYPVSKKTIDFVLNLSKNIQNIQIFVGEFSEFVAEYGPKKIYYKEHPLNEHYHGVEEQRDWMFSVKGYYPSFFSFWKKCQKEMPF